MPWWLAQTLWLLPRGKRT